MKNALTLTKNQTHFLEENRQDPVTKDNFSLGDEVVFCASCKSAFLKESWEYMGSEHCNQRETLSSFPSISVLKLKKHLVYDSMTVTLQQRLGAFVIDSTICLLIIAIGSPLITWVESILNKDIFLKSFYVLIFCCFLYLLFRDAFLLNGSSGKKYYDLYFIDVQTKKRPHFFKIAIRNLLFWIPNFLAFSYFYFPSQVNEIDAAFSGFRIVSGLFSFIILLLGNFTYFLYTLTQEQPFFDKLLRIQLVKKK